MRMLVAALALILALLIVPAQAAGIRVYFSLIDDPGGAVLTSLQTASRQVLVAIYDLTDARLARALIADRHRGLDVRIVMDAHQASSPYSQYPVLVEALGDRVVLRSGRGSRYAIMHDKFAVVDGHVVLTGSFNWTHTAECCNNENLIIIDDPALAQSFAHEFQRIWTEK